MGKNIDDKKNWNKMKNKKIEKETKQKSKKLNNMKKLEKNLKNNIHRKIMERWKNCKKIMRIKNSKNYWRKWKI